MSKKLTAAVLSACMLLSLLPATAFAWEASELTTDIGEKTFVVGQPMEFTFTTTANDDADVMVVGGSNFSDEDAIETLEYWEINGETWLPLSPGSNFGGSQGFPMGDAVSTFRVTFQTAGDYTFTAYMQPVEGGEPLCSVEVDFHVEPKAEDVVAQVDGKNYDSLLKAVQAAGEEDTITLMADCVLPDNGSIVEYNFPAGSTLELDGYSLTSNKKSFFQGADVTIQNGRLENELDYAIWIGNATEETSITLKDVTANGGVNVYMGETVLENCTLDASTKNFYAVYADEGGSVIVKSGVYTGGATGVVNTSYKTAPSVQIVGGTFVGKVYEGYKDAVSITGGIFDNDVTNYCEDGLAWDENTHGITIPANSVAYNTKGRGYLTLQAAINAAAPGDIIEMMTDVKESVVIDKDLTLNGNGNRITLDAEAAANITAIPAINGESTPYSAIVAVTNGANVTLNGVNIAGNPAEVSKISALTHATRYLGLAALDANVTMTGGSVKDICYEDHLNGMQNGIGVYAVSTEKTTLALTNVEIGNFAKGGIVARANVDLEMTGGSVTGFGATDVIAQNGIQYSGNATIRGTVISGIRYTAENEWKGGAMGIMNYPTAGATTSLIENVTCTDVDYAIAAYEGGATEIRGVNFTDEGEGASSVWGDEGTLEIYSGTFKNDVTEYCIDGYKWDEESKGIVPMGEFVAMNGERGYFSLQAAVDGAQNGDRVILQKNWTENVTVAIGQDIILDLNGCTLSDAEQAQDTSVPSRSRQHTITNYGTLVIEGEGTVDNKSHGKAAVYNDGTITLAGGTYTRSAEAGYYDAELGKRVNGGNSWYVVRNNSGTMNVEDGAAILGTSGFSSMVSNGNNFGDAVLNISGGRLESANYVAIQNQIGCTLNISGGTVEGTGAPYCLSLYGTTNISDSAEVNGWVQVWSYDFYAKGREDNDHPIHIESTLNISGGTLNDTQLQAVHGLSGYDPTVSVEQLNLNETYALWGTGDTKSLINITGGTINMEEGLLTCRITNEGGIGRGTERIENGGAAEIRVSAGDFSSPVELEYCAEDLLPVEKSEGVYGVTDEELKLTADPAERTGGGAVTLTVAPAKITADVEVTCDKEITIAANGDGTYTASLPNVTQEYTFTVTAGGKRASCSVAVTRSSSGGGGGGGTVTPPQEEIEDPDVPLAQLLPFADVAETDWFYDAVRFAYDRDMMNGTNAAGTLFEPGLSTTRGMIVTILYRLEKTPEAEAASFTDVVGESWYTDAVNWGAANGVIKGYGDGSFHPNDTITREELAAILSRYAAFKGYDKTALGDLSMFSDGEQVSSWAREDMVWAVGVGLLKGRENGQLDPKGAASRAETAQILKNFCECFESKEEEK